MRGSTEKTSRRAFLQGAGLTGALALASGLGMVEAGHAADPQLDQADQALQKAAALMDASQAGGVSPKAQRQFDRHRARAVRLIARARDEVAAAKAAVDSDVQSAGSP